MLQGGDTQHLDFLINLISQTLKFSYLGSDKSTDCRARPGLLDGISSQSQV